MGEHPERSFGVSFEIGETVEDCYADLRRQWRGDPESLRLDCWGAVEQADGYDVSLVTSDGEPTADRLFFVNLGGFSPTEFTELHRNVLVVAEDAAAAKAKALTLVQDWCLPTRTACLRWTRPLISPPCYTA